MSRLGEWALSALSRDPGEPDIGARPPAEDAGSDPLSLLRRELSDLSWLAGKRLLDYGCGEGQQSLALAEEEECEVWAYDTNPRTLARARRLAETRSATAEGGDAFSRVHFVSSLDEVESDSFDAVLSHNSMEHFPDPRATLEEMKALLKPGGALILTFGPPWFAPHGSHMNYFTRVPWVNLLFSESTVMNVRSQFRDDGATRYEEVESGLNRMSIAKFEGLASEVGMRARLRRYTGVKGLDWLGRLPLARELFVNHVTCVLEKPQR